MYGAEPSGSVPYGYVKDAGVASKFQQTIEADGGHVVLVEFYAKEIGAADETFFQYSDRGYTSPNLNGGPNDNVHFDGRVTSPLQVSRTLPIAPESSRRLTADVGSIELIGTDGEFDDFLSSYAVDGREIQVKIGLDGFYYRDFTTVFLGKIVSCKTDFDTLSISVGNAGLDLDRPLQTNFYGGTGGIDGSTSIANAPKPICLQTVSNETPVFIDPANLVYQINDGVISAITDIRDAGVSLTFSADYSTYAALTAASLSVGDYATSLALGIFRLGGSPAGNVTFDATGSVYSSTLLPSADIVMSILKTFGGLSDSDIDADAIANIDQDIKSGFFTPESGKYFDQAINVSDALDTFLGSIFWYWGSTIDGRVTVGKVTAAEPSDGLPSTTSFDEVDVRDLEILDQIDGTYPPRWRQSFGFNRNGTIQKRSEMAGTVSDSDVQIFGRQYDTITTEDSGVKDDFLNAVDASVLVTPYQTPDVENIHTYYAAFLARLISLFGKLTTPVRIDVGRQAMKLSLGERVKLTHPRIRSGQYWFALVIDIDIDIASDKYDVYLWANIPAPE